MKWGVRRYQSYAENPKLSDRKKKKYGKKAAVIDKALENVKSSYDRASKTNSSLKEAQKKSTNNLSKMPDKTINRMITDELGNNWKNEPDFDGYKKDVNGARKFLEDNGIGTKTEYNSGIRNSERTMKMAESIIKKYSDKRIEDISKKDLKVAEKLIKNAGDYNLEDALYYLEYGKRSNDLQLNTTRDKNEKDFKNKYGSTSYT